MLATIRAISRRPLVRTLLAAGAFAATSTVGLAPAAMAFPPSPLEIHEKVHKKVRKNLKRLFDVPRRLHDSHRRTFDAYFGGRSYYAPHHHHHTVYRLPVYVHERVVTRPYWYCNDSLFIGAGVALPPLVIEIGSRYPADRPASPRYVRVPSYGRRGHNHDCDRDRHDHDRYDDDHDDDHDR